MIPDGTSMAHFPGTPERLEEFFVEGFTTWGLFKTCYFRLKHLKKFAAPGCRDCLGAGWRVSALVGPAYQHWNGRGKGQSSLCECASQGIERVLAEFSPETPGPAREPRAPPGRLDPPKRA